MVQLGIDIGGTSVKAAVWANGRCTGTGQSAFYSQPTTEELRAAIFAAAGPLTEVNHVGLCVPGVFDAGRRVITLSVNVPGLVDLPLDRVVTSALGLADGPPAVISNDATAAAFDIFHARRLRGRLLVITLGTGVGNAVLDEGTLLNLGGGASGHLGQIDVSIPGHEDTLGPDGGAGGLEGYIGVAALRRHYGHDVSKALAHFTGDEPAIHALVRAIRISHAIYRPNHVCLCGGVGVRLQHLLPTIRRQIENHLTNLARPGWTLTCGEDDFHAARGAAAMAAGA